LKLSVSVIIPAYNRALIIGRAIESALSQTYLPAEIIVVDDGSEDQTQEIVRAFPGVRYIRQANTGAAQARNNGVELAGCDYVAFLDSDDLWVHQKLEMQMKLIERLEVPILGSRKRYVHERSRLSLDVDPRGRPPQLSAEKTIFSLLAVLTTNCRLPRIGIFGYELLFKSPSREWTRS
jgi:glycosyltransferase involved in cell wall biosynthesis